MQYIPDNYDLWEANDREQARRLEKFPTCEICGDAIQQERAFHKDGFLICDECIENNRREVIDE